MPTALLLKDGRGDHPRSSRIDPQGDVGLQRIWREWQACQIVEEERLNFWYNLNRLNPAMRNKESNRIHKHIEFFSELLNDATSEILPHVSNVVCNKRKKMQLQETIHAVMDEGLRSQIVTLNMDRMKHSSVPMRAFSEGFQRAG
jgi:hypothetical protein